MFCMASPTTGTRAVVTLVFEQQQHRGKTNFLELNESHVSVSRSVVASAPR